jgi:hypothetical protein
VSPPVADIVMRAGGRAERVAAETRERFLTVPRAGVVVFFLLFAATYDEGRVHEDGVTYFAFLRTLFGADTPAAAYQFGSAFWNAPFYLVSQLVAARGQFDHYHAGEVSVAVASNAAIVLTLYLGWRILKELNLPRGPGVLLLTLFGTPLFFFGAVWVSYKHAADTLYATAAFWFVLRSTRNDARRRDYIAAGTCLALLLATRYANLALAIGILTAFAVLGLRRAATWMLTALVLVSIPIFELPVIRHIPYTLPSQAVAAPPAMSSDLPAIFAQPVQRSALSAGVSIDPVLRGVKFQATAPVKMLFTLHRGLFLWTPLTAFATACFVLLLRRDRRHRPFLAALGVSALALLAVHSLWGPEWAGGGSFSQRFLTALFPFFLVGAAEFIRRTRKPGIVVLSFCAAWSLWIGLVQVNSYYGSSANDGLVQIVENFKSFTGPRTTRYRKPPPYDSIQNFGRDTRNHISERWQLYWRLVS